MADKENQLSTGSRAARKRQNDSGPGNQMVKKRAALGELTNNSPVAIDLNESSIVGKNRRLKPEHVMKKAESEITVELVAPGSDQTPRFGHVPSMYQYLHSMEVEAERRPLSNYVEKVQTDITPVMRSILVDWMVEVAEEYKLVSDTLYLTVHYIDRYLSTHNLSRSKLQLLGVSCMLVASKYEEITPPHVEDFCYITDNTYTKEEVLQMEKDVLKFLDSDTGIPTTRTFLRIFSKGTQEKPEFSDVKFDLFCCYLAEMSLVDYGCIRYIPSMIAASAIFLGRLTIQPKIHPWTRTLQQKTGYKPCELKECVLRLNNLQLKSEKYARSIRQKYMEPKFKCVASLEPPSNVPSRFFEVSNE